MNGLAQIRARREYNAWPNDYVFYELECAGGSPRLA